MPSPTTRAEVSGAASAPVVLLDTRHQADESGIQIVAEALRGPTSADLGFLTGEPVLFSAREGR